MRCATIWEMNKKSTGLLILLLVYIVASVIGVFSYIGCSYLGMNDYLSVLIGDVLATIFVYIMGVIFKTASMYDPYWSLQTFVIYLGLLCKYDNWNIGTILLLIVISLYSFRLTFNFILGFDSLSYIDWRYRMLKDRSGRFFQLVNLFGICLFPTLVVYACSLPSIVYASIGSFSYLDIIGLSLTIIGILELISDIEMKKFIKIRKDRSEVISFGLWKYSRHPNYLGEILIWFGVALTLIISTPQYWYLIFGSVANLLMFIFISIPMEEKHMKQYKDGYDIYLKTTSPLLLLPRRKMKNK